MATVSPEASTRNLKNLKLPFGNDLVFAIVKDKPTENIIVSPVGVQACMALVCLGAHGETSKELEDHLKLGGSSKIALMEEFGKFLETDARGPDSKIKMANRLYVDTKYQISTEFSKQALQYFDSEAVNINLAKPAEVAKKINAWVYSKTDEKIQQLIQANSIKKGTAAILVNAIFLKAKWATIFDSTRTSKRDFYVNDKVTVEVDMMYQKEMFTHGYVKALDATVVELNFHETNISMIIILPKVKAGLTVLEEHLRKFDITKLTKDLTKSKIHLYLPRFQVEYDVSLQPILEKLGMRKIFTKDAQLSTLLAANEPLAIGIVKQKALLAIYEVGTDINALSSMNVARDEDPATEMVVNHPFFFIIRDNEAIYLTGHVIKI